MFSGRGLARIVLLGVLFVVLLGAVPAHGATTIITAPDETYLATTRKVPLAGIPNDTPLTSVTDGILTVSSSVTLWKGNCPETTGFSNWGMDGLVEAVTNVDDLVGVGSPTFTLSRPVTTFGFEAEHGASDTPAEITVTFVVSNGGVVVGVVSRTVTPTSGTSNFNARLFAITSDVPFDRVTMVHTSPASWAIGQIRYALPPVNVYRFYNPRLGVHFYTADEAEKANVQATLSSVFTYEGAAYAMNSSANMTPLYRFLRRSTGTHFYTADAGEKANVEATLGSVYAYEGVAYGVSSSPGVARITIYRFFNRRTGTHFYTADQAERDNVINTLGSIYTYEGTGFWVIQ